LQAKNLAPPCEKTLVQNHPALEKKRHAQIQADAPTFRGIADEYLKHANRNRPEHLEAILAPSIVPGE